MRYTRFSLISIFSLLLVVACSTAPKRQFAEIPDFQTVAVVLAADHPSFDNLDSYTDKSMQGANVGAASGGVAGMAAGAVMCGVTGPFAGLCISGLGLAGMLGGGAAGLLYGFDGVPQQYEDQIAVVMERIGQRRELQYDLRLALQGNIAPAIQAKPQAADVVVTPVLLAIKIDREGEDLVRVKAAAELIFSWTNELGESYLGKADFVHNTAGVPIETYLSYSAGGLEKAIDEAIENLSQQMNARINLRVGMPAIPESTGSGATPE